MPKISATQWIIGLVILGLIIYFGFYYKKDPKKVGESKYKETFGDFMADRTILSQVGG